MAKRTSRDEIKSERPLTVEGRAAYEGEARVSAFRSLVYRLRTEAGLTQAELAERMGTTQSAIARMEGGGTRPTLETLEKLRALNAKTVIITDRRNKEAAAFATAVIRVPVLIRELYTPIPYIIPAQLFAAALAGAKGLDADQPRGLRKITSNL